MEAKQHLSRYYWKAYVVTLLLGLLAGGVGNAGIVNVDVTTGMSLELIRLFLIAFAIGSVISLVIGIFLTNILTVGVKRFFLCARLGDVSIDHMLDGFRNGNYGNVLLTMFLMQLKVFLWSLLFIVPGIIKAYEYRMIPYILGENPSIDCDEAFAQSKVMMEGEKWNTFVLELSFLGWYLLGVLLCGIGTTFVVPYQEATITELYDKLRLKVYRRSGSY